MRIILFGFKELSVRQSYGIGEQRVFENILDSFRREGILVSTHRGKKFALVHHPILPRGFASPRTLNCGNTGLIYSVTSQP